jgi:hypothetical protein
MRRSSWLFVGGAGTLVIGAVVLGLSVISAPEERRKESLDEMRVNDLSALKQGVMAYYHTNGRLPDSRDALPKWSSAQHLVDPETGAPYEYIAKDLRNFQVCAVFDTSSMGTKASYHRVADDWVHEKGHYCFADAAPLPRGQR